MRVESTPAAGKFVIVLCSVATPVTIPQPRSPQLTRFKFFLGQSVEAGRKRYTLYMGYFTTLAEAEKWLTVLRGIYPNAVVSEQAATPADSFSDTQVLSILEERRADPAATVADESAVRNISLLRPDDTGTRVALKDAVRQNAPVLFAVQLQWSTHSIGLETVPRHPIFSSYTLYTTPARLEGREWFCLRLGFFGDAISAKQVAQFLFSDFPSVAVVPVDPQEHARALETGKRSTGAVLSAQIRQERGRDTKAAPSTGSASADARAPVRQAAAVPTSRDSKNAPAVPTSGKRVGISLEDTLETLRTSEFAMDGEDESNTTGVRHLQVIKERTAARQPTSASPQRRKM
jgi:hypothetical protein